MNKFTLSIALFVISTTGLANTAAPEPDTQTAYTSVRNLPVIVKNEAIAHDSCRLSFEDGSSKDVPCDNTHRLLPENIAASE